jgi:hypothetical protein
MELTVNKLSLRLHDPARNVGSLLRKWGLEVKYSWTAGEPSCAPNGRLLGGVRESSYAVATFQLNELNLSRRLGLVLDILKPNADELTDFVNEGGKAELYAFMDCVGNSGTGLDWPILRRVAAHKLQLSLDIYPEWPEPEDDPNA